MMLAGSSSPRIIPRARLCRRSSDRRVGVQRSRLASSATAVDPGRAQDWRLQSLGLWAAFVVLWTALDCFLDPGMEYPWGVVGVALPTSILVAPGAAIAACSRMASLPFGLGDVGTGQRVAAVFVGDSLTHGSLSANYLEVLAQRYSGQGIFVNVGMNMRPASELLDGSLLEDVAAAAPKRGVVILIGTNDLIRYTLLPAALRQPVATWLEGYASTLREIVQRLRSKGVATVTLASPPILGEDPASEEGRLGECMAAEVRRVADAESCCHYAPLYEATVSHLSTAASEGTLAPRSRAYSALESFALLCGLPWRIYAARMPLSEIQSEQGLELTLDLVHFGPRFAEIAANVLSEALSLEVEAV